MQCSDSEMCGPSGSVPNTERADRPPALPFHSVIPAEGFQEVGGRAPTVPDDTAQSLVHPDVLAQNGPVCAVHKVWKIVPDFDAGEGSTWATKVPVAFVNVLAPESDPEELHLCAEIPGCIADGHSSLNVRSSDGLVEGGHIAVQSDPSISRQEQDEHVGGDVVARESTVINMFGRASRHSKPKLFEVLAGIEDTVIGTHYLDVQRNPSSHRAFEEAEALPPPHWGFYVKVPIVVVFANVILVAIQFSIYLAAMGWIGTLETARNPMRGMASILVPGWSVAFFASFSELCLGSKISVLGGISSSIAFTAACTFLAALRPDMGLVLVVMGGVVLHCAAIVGWGIVFLRRSGRSWKDAFVQALYWLALFSCVLFTAFLGWFTFTWFPWMGDEFNLIAGPSLTLVCKFGEDFSVVLVKKLDKIFYRRVYNSRTMGSWAVMFIHCVSESIRFVTLWFSAIRDPGSYFRWVSCLIMTVFINVFGRLGWTSYIAWQLTKHPFWIPSCWASLHKDARFAFGYGRFGAPLAVVGARLMLGTSQAIAFNNSVVLVWVGSLLAELFEDIAVLVCQHFWRPNFFADPLIREHTSRRNLIDPDTATVAVTISQEDGKAIHKVHGKEKPFPSLFGPLSIVNASTFLACTGLMMTVSVDYVLGSSTQHLTFFDPNGGLYNGALLWKHT